MKSFVLATCLFAIAGVASLVEGVSVWLFVYFIPAAQRAVPEPLSALGQTLARMQEVDHSLDPAGFLDGAEKAFRLIVSAFASADRTTLRNLRTTCKPQREQNRRKWECRPRKLLCLDSRIKETGKTDYPNGRSYTIACALSVRPSLHPDQALLRVFAVILLAARGFVRATATVFLFFLVAAFTGESNKSLGCFGLRWRPWCSGWMRAASSSARS